MASVGHGIKGSFIVLAETGSHSSDSTHFHSLSSANAPKYGHVDFDRSQHFYRLNRLDPQADTEIGLEEAHESRHQNALASFERLAYNQWLEFKKIHTSFQDVT